MQVDFVNFIHDFKYNKSNASELWSQGACSRNTPESKKIT